MTDPHAAEELAAGGHRAPAHHAVADGDTADTYWNRFHAEPHPAWSGGPNATLVSEMTGVTPGTALDLGCGEGGDAIWLAAQGWTVTAIDIARPALDRARDRAAEAGVANRITWVRCNLTAWRPATTFDLVSVHYLHSPVDLERGRILQAAVSAVAPGGVLLIVGHVGTPAEHDHPGQDMRFPTPDEVVADLDLDAAAWQVERAAVIPHATADDAHRPDAPADAVVRILRT
jgi:SAM-dependent methyltransferase